ncbi:MAG TPA: flippase activity-associated protein Agl23 [Gaiellaceae bacterium]|nr:flippase activity-associated protein Agl23 [Gaiellaceae bacterium]
MSTSVPSHVTFSIRRDEWLARTRAWVASWGREAVPFASMAAVALVLRLIGLDDKAMHHDEAQHAWFGWRLETGEGYSYDPVFHGPVQFYLIALADFVLGAGDYVTRLPVALVGSIAVFLPFFVRRQLGTVAALTASVALAVGPSYLYVSRFLREDIHVTTVNLAGLVVLIRFLDKPSRWHPIALLSLVAVAFATKETTYITVFVLGLFFAALVVSEAIGLGRGARGVLDTKLVRDIRSLGVAWAWGASAFLIVYTLLFSTFLTSPEGLREGLVGSIDYWLSQQDVNRGGQPWFYYLVLIPAYEWPVVLLGVIGTGVIVRRPTTTGALLVWMFVFSLAIYSWASERMPWLVVHPLLPLILLAGIGAQKLWDERSRGWARVAVAATAVLAVGWVYSSVQLVYFRSADARELLVQVQSSDDVPVIRDELLLLREVAEQTSGEPPVVQVDSWGGTGWPWSWYFRDAPVGYYDMSVPDQVDPGAVLLVTDPNHAAMAPKLQGYDARRFRLRVWWVPEWGAATPADWARWALTRRVWSPTATMDEWLYVREDVAELASETPPK